MRRLRGLVILIAVAIAAPLIASASVLAQQASPVSGIATRVAGDARELIPETDPGVLSVAMIEVIELNGSRNQVVVIYRNNTDHAVYDIGFVATMRTPDGAIFGVSDSGYVIPREVAAGDVAFGIASFSGIEYVDGYGLDISTNFADEPGSAAAYRSPGLIFTNIVKFDNRIVGEAVNDLDRPVSAFVIRGVCFNDGKIAGDLIKSLLLSDVQPGTVVPFQVDIRERCDHFLIASS